MNLATWPPAGSTAELDPRATSRPSRPRSDSLISTGLSDVLCSATAVFSPRFLSHSTGVIRLRSGWLSPTPAIPKAAWEYLTTPDAGLSALTCADPDTRAPASSAVNVAPPKADTQTHAV